MLLDGLSTQVALDDPEITSDVAYDIAMEYAEQRLGSSARTAPAAVSGGRARGRGD